MIINWESYPARVSGSVKEPSANNSWVDGLRVRAKVSPGYELAPENPGGVGAGVCMDKFFKLTLTREEFPSHPSHINEF